MSNQNMRQYMNLFEGWEDELGWTGRPGWYLLADDHEVLKDITQANAASLKQRYSSPIPADGYIGYVDADGNVVAHYNDGKTLEGRPW
jgi:hypothetical protein